MRSLPISPLDQSIKAVRRHAGRPPIDPRILFALWLYATTRGVGSARLLEQGSRGEDDLTALAPIGPRPQGGTEAALDHRVDRLRLPPLAVPLPQVLPPLPHPAAPIPGRWLLRGPPALRWDDGTHPKGLPGLLMDPFRVAVGIGQQRPDPHADHHVVGHPRVLAILHIAQHMGDPLEDRVPAQGAAIPLRTDGDVGLDP